MTQLTLFAAPTKPRPKRTASQKRGYHYDHYSRHMGMDPYDPRECRRRILAALEDGEWIDFPEMCGIVKMPTRAIGHMLDLLIQWGTAGEDGDVLRRARRRQARPPAQ